MRNRRLNKVLNLLAVYLLYDAEIPNIERLGNMRRVRREIEGDNVVLLVVCLKGIRQVTLMAV